MKNSILMKSARTALVGKWDVAVFAFIIYLFIIYVIEKAFDNLGLEGLGSFLFEGVFSVGFAFFYLSVARNQPLNVDMMFKGFSRFGTALLASLLAMIFVILWSLLLIIPGVVALLSFSMVYFIIADNPTISAYDALKLSKKMMYGHKWKYFRLILRFTGWFILSILTVGIGFLFLVPYFQTANAEFYEDIKSKIASK
ncbi:MAG TPA: DUF975 family protein [Leadbetterella sp.]|nr:DUF975 family protein [Leadbetterella sp.]